MEVQFVNHEYNSRPNWTTSITRNSESLQWKKNHVMGCAVQSQASVHTVLLVQKLGQLIANKI